MRRNMLMRGIAAIIVAGLMLGYGAFALLEPPNPVWALFSGSYTYDPRHEIPPPDLMLDRPEDSLTYFLDATLELCNGVYPPGQQRQVQRYEVERVEYFGRTRFVLSSYQAYSRVHTRLYFTDGTSVLAVFQFNAGHNEHDIRSLGEMNNIRAGAWMAHELIRDPDHPPPGWSVYPENEDMRPFTCQQAEPPYEMREWQYERSSP